MANLEWLEVVATVLAVLGSFIVVLRYMASGFRRHMEFLFHTDFDKIDSQLNEVRVGNASVNQKLEEAIGYHKKIDDKLDCVQQSNDRIEATLSEQDHKIHLVQIWAKSMYHALVANNAELRSHLPDPDDYFNQPKP